MSLLSSPSSSFCPLPEEMPVSFAYSPRKAFKSRTSVYSRNYSSEGMSIQIFNKFWWERCLALGFPQSTDNSIYLSCPDGNVDKDCTRLCNLHRYDLGVEPLRIQTPPEIICLFLQYWSLILSGHFLKTANECLLSITCSRIPWLTIFTAILRIQVIRFVNHSGQSCVVMQELVTRCELRGWDTFFGRWTLSRLVFLKIRTRALVKILPIVQLIEVLSVSKFCLS